MKIIDIVNGPWAIKPNMLQEIQRIYGSHLHREQKLNAEHVIASVEAATGRSVKDSRSGSYVVDGVAVIPLQGVIGKKMNLFTQICGGASTEAIAADFQAAMQDTGVKAIVLHGDSPGGTVDGTMQLANIIASYKGQKPVLTCADGMLCSAAYWIGSQTDSIYIADLTTDVGSIGVVASHMDISGWEEKQGVKTTEITAGKYKRAVSQYAPLSEEGRAMIQADLDQIYSLFVDAVATGRGVTVDTVLADMAEGQVFLGQKAIDAGLADGIATLSETIQEASRRAGLSTTGGWKRAIAARTDSTQEVSTMTLEQLKADHPNLVEAIAAEATAGHAEAIEAAHAAGAAAELDRIKAVKAQSIPGHEALVESLAMDGKSTAADAALAIVAAEKQQGTAAAAALEADANPAVDTSAEPSAVKSVKRADFDNMTTSERQAFRAAGGKIID